MTATDHTTEFDNIVAAWGGQLCCQTSQSRRPCRNPARWIALAHTCNERRTVLLCTMHKNRWTELMWEVIAWYTHAQCPMRCGEVFVTPSEYAAFRPV